MRPTINDADKPQTDAETDVPGEPRANRTADPTKRAIAAANLSALPFMHNLHHGIDAATTDYEESTIQSSLEALGLERDRDFRFRTIGRGDQGITTGKRKVTIMWEKNFAKLANAGVEFPGSELYLD